MGKIRLEICLISARGLRRSSSLWKLHWYAVGWVDSKNKYCTRVDTSGSTNPSWRTKFPVSIDDYSESNWESLALHVEVYSRGAIFLRERLQGTAVVLLKEFLANYNTNKDGSRSSGGGGGEEEHVGSFQLRKKHNNSEKQAQGFVDISIRISAEEDPVFSSYPYPLAHNNGGEGFFHLNTGDGNGGNTNNRNSYSASQPPYLSHPDMRPSGHAEISQPQPQIGSPATYDPHPSMQPYPANYYNARPSQPPPQGVGEVSGAASYQPPRTPPPPPPPSHVGYIPTILPSAGHLPGTYVNIPSSSTGGRRASGQNFGMGMGAGALAAGAVLFGDDFMSGFQIPSSLQDDSHVVSMDSPF